MVEQEVVRALVEFADPLAGPADAALLDRLCVRSAELFTACDALVHLARPPHPPSLTDRTRHEAGGPPQLRGASRPGAGRLGPLPELAAGPVAVALHDAEPVVVVELGGDRRWPDLAALPAAAGVTLVAAPMRRGQEVAGVLTVLRRAPWRPDEVAAVAALADVTAVRLAAQRALDEAAAVADQLQHALDSRVVIEQAKGIVAARDSLDMRNAFERLRRHARTRGRKIHDVARDVVEGSLTLEG